jgi:hypothetical protein
VDFLLVAAHSDERRLSRCPTSSEEPEDSSPKSSNATAGEGESSDCYCPYCGTQAATDEFLADQMPRLNAAMEAAEQYGLRRSTTSWARRSGSTLVPGGGRVCST